VFSIWSCRTVAPGCSIKLVGDDFKIDKIKHFPLLVESFWSLLEFQEVDVSAASKRG